MESPLRLIGQFAALLKLKALGLEMKVADELAYIHLG
jgi:hypothetical protein